MTGLALGDGSAFGAFFGTGLERFIVPSEESRSYPSLSSRTEWVVVLGSIGSPHPLSRSLVRESTLPLSWSATVALAFLHAASLLIASMMILRYFTVRWARTTSYRGIDASSSAEEHDNGSNDHEADSPADQAPTPVAIVQLALPG